MTSREKYGPGLCVRVPEEVRVLVKQSARSKNITVQKWVLRAIMRQIEKERSYE